MQAVTHAVNIPNPPSPHGLPPLSAAPAARFSQLPCHTIKGKVAQTPASAGLVIEDASQMGQLVPRMADPLSCFQALSFQPWDNFVPRYNQAIGTTALVSVLAVIALLLLWAAVARRR